MLVLREAMAEGASCAYKMQTVFLVECLFETVFESALGQNVLAESMFVGEHV